MVKEVLKWKGGSKKQCGNEDDELDIEVQGKETTAMGIQFGAYN